jgi:hypothetical protein
LSKSIGETDPDRDLLETSGMSDESENLDQLVMIGGAGGDHPAADLQLPLVAPSTDARFNTLRTSLRPVSCVLLKDSRFAFDSSVISPRVSIQMKFLARLRQRRPGILVSVFGHADPVGNDDYNKQLSGRRAQAVYALLTRRPDLWEHLFSEPFGGDKWGDGAIGMMLATLGHDTEGNDDDDGTALSAAVRAFQTETGLAPDGVAGPATRQKLFRAYMEAICIDPSGKPFQLDQKEDFLAGGVDSGGKGDYQGCGEFNPVLLFSKSQKAEFDADSDKTQRDNANRANRRVMIFLFPERMHVIPASWPCPRVKEGTAGCKLRFFSDADSRRTNGESQREYTLTQDTFACRFYDRFAHNSPCETGPDTGFKCHIAVLLRSNSGCVPLANRKYKVTINANRILEGTTDSNGLVKHSNVPAGDYSLEIEGHTTFVPATPVFREPREHQVNDFFLFEDEDMPPAPSPAPGLDDEVNPPEALAQNEKPKDLKELDEDLV